MRCVVRQCSACWPLPACNACVLLLAVLLVRCSWSAQPLICGQLVSPLHCGSLASNSSYDDVCFAHGQVRDNLSEGLRFYASLQEALTALAQHVGDFCLTRRIQR